MPMNNARIRGVLSLVLNSANAVLVTVSILWFFIGGGVGNMAVSGSRCFIYFTNDSNILAALCSLAAIPFAVLSLVRGRDSYPAWVLTLNAAGTAAVTLTMLVVLVFLGPTQGYAAMYDGVCLPLHLICPLLSLVSFCFFERGLVFTKKRLVLAVLPAFVYGTVYLVNVVFTGTWEDFYGFNIGGFWYLSYIVIIAVTYALALGIGALHNAFEK